MPPIRTLMARDVAREIAVNAAMALPLVRKWRVNRGRTSPRFTGDRESVERHAFQALRGIERYAGTLTGKSVVEFGPGDTLSSGFAMLAAGAKRYVAVDRFVPDYSSQEAKRWYAGVRSSWATAFPGRAWPDDLEPEFFPEQYPELVGQISGAVEEASADARYDVVSSWQVGEHVRDVSRFAALTAGLLLSEGVAVHRVDFGPHDCWLAYDDPLTFLSLPSPVWTAMGSNRGIPNRVRHHEFMEAWVAASLKVECHDITRFAPSELRVGRYRRRYRRAPGDSLLVRDVVYVCRHRLPSGDVS